MAANERMSIPSHLQRLPEGYELERGPRGLLALERSARDVLRRVGFGTEGGESIPAGDLAGRRPLGTIDAGDERWVVRRFHHGGLLRWLGEALFLNPSRPFQELALASALRSRGLPTPRIVAARAVRCVPLGWRLALVSARVEGTADGAEVLERMRAGELSFVLRRRALRTVGALVGRLHAARFLHADLHPRNLLLSSDLASAWVLDLDRGRFREALGTNARRDNLRRLYRAVRRREARGRSFLTRGDLLCFLSAYGEEAGTSESWRADWRAILRRARRREPIHRLGWWLEEALGAGPEARGRPLARS